MEVRYISSYHSLLLLVLRVELVIIYLLGSIKSFKAASSVICNGYYQVEHILNYSIWDDNFRLCLHTNLCCSEKFFFFFLNEREVYHEIFSFDHTM